MYQNERPSTYSGTYDDWWDRHFRIDSTGFNPDHEFQKWSSNVFRVSQLPTVTIEIGVRCDYCRISSKKHYNRIYKCNVNGEICVAECFNYNFFATDGTDTPGRVYLLKHTCCVCGGTGKLKCKAHGLVAPHYYCPHRKDWTTYLKERIKNI